MSAKKQTTKKQTNKQSSKKSNAKRTQKALQTKKNKSEEAVKVSRFSPRVRAILFGLLGAGFLAMILIKGENIWTAIRGFFFGVFGLSIILVPIFLFYLCIITEKEKNVRRIRIKITLCILTVFFAGVVFYVIGGAKFSSDEYNYLSCLGNLYLEGADTTNYFNISCGIVGGILGYPLTKLGGTTVALVVSILTTVALIFIVANISVKDIASAASRRASVVKEGAERYAVERKAKREERRAEIEQQKAVQNQKIDIPISGTSPAVQSAIPQIGDGIDIPLDEPKSKRKKKKNILLPKENIDIDYVDSNEQNAVEKDLSEDLLNIIHRASKPHDKSFDSTVEDIANEITQEKHAEVEQMDSAKQKTEPVKTKAKKSSEQAEEIEELKDVGYKIDNSNLEQKEEHQYKFPPIQLLKPSNNDNDRSAREELENNSKKLIETLHSFGVNANIVNISRGPSVTRYELQPAPGVKISKITNLADDIALNLAANGVRIEAPIPGKAAVGIEVPNKVVSMVSMRELIDSDEFRNSKSKLTCVLGRDISGEIVVTDLAKMPHLLVAGTTGSGKSVCVNSMLMSILFKATPDEVKILLIDPKMVEFSKYKGIPHLLIPVVSDAKKAAGALSWAVNEMLQRYKIFSEYDCKDIDSYNNLIERNLKYIEENPPVENDEGELIQPVMEVNGLPVAKEKMCRVVIAIDELADLMMAAPSEVEDSICRLAQMARAAGMHLILATQRPTVNVITGLIKANVPSRISLKVSSNMDSRTILDAGGGEKLIGKGDMLFAPIGCPKPIRVQGCYASDSEIEGVTSFIKKSHKAEYNADIEEKIKRIAAEEIATGKKSGGSDDEDDGLDVDSKMDEAIQCVIEAGQASTSLIQRRLKVGYARAGRMIDDMERLGVVGPHQGSKPRDVLMTYNEWIERRNILQNRSGNDE